MHTSLSENKSFTINEYLKITDDKQYEVIEGELRMVPAPSFEHQDFSANLVFIFSQYVRKKSLGKVLFAPSDVILDEKNIVQPDILYISVKNKEIVQKGKVFGSPDLVIEIISKGSKHADYFKKKDLYEKFGIKEYWLVDPFSESVEVLVLDDNNRYDLYSEGFIGEDGNITVKSKVIEGLEVNIEEIFKKDW